MDQVQSVLSACCFHRKFIPKFAQEAEPLYSLLCEKSTFEWKEKCGDAFKCIKNKLVDEELPRFTKPFAIQSDAAKKELALC